ncbi:hypothetical protein AAFF_G00207690 [Aldrovandia affinis]|uniref:Uncharacterized protein n=1 Tax=Aldrovandia affinis TaxID=143900 RepID=A0AAD7W4R1_9TELE|nr:hypothetical protein AAFF_G00207690 [Aldrovandia affinis]
MMERVSERGCAQEGDALRWKTRLGGLSVLGRWQQRGALSLQDGFVPRLAARRTGFFISPIHLLLTPSAAESCGDQDVPPLWREEPAGVCALRLHADSPVLGSLVLEPFSSHAFCHPMTAEYRSQRPAIVAPYPGYLQGLELSASQPSDVLRSTLNKPERSHRFREYRASLRISQEQDRPGSTSEAGKYMQHKAVSRRLPAPCLRPVTSKRSAEDMGGALEALC